MILTAKKLSTHNKPSKQEDRKTRKTSPSGQPAANDAAKFRLYPTQEQYNLISKTIGCARYLWNLIIDIALITYEDLGFSLVIQPAEAKKNDRI